MARAKKAVALAADARTFKIKTKDGTLVVEGASPLAITGLAADTVVADGDYVAVAVENGKESAAVAIPGFTVLPAASGE